MNHTSAVSNSTPSAPPDPSVAVSPSAEQAAPQPQPAPEKSLFCKHRTPSGRHCRNLVHDQIYRLCRKHAKALHTLDNDGFSSDLTPIITDNPRDLDTLEGVHSCLSSLAVLLAQNSVSTRRAAVLAYICTQLIRTNIAIEKRDATQPPEIFFDVPRPTHGSQP